MPTETAHPSSSHPYICKHTHNHLLVSIHYVLTMTIIFKCFVISKTLLYAHMGRILLCTCTYLHTVLQRHRLTSIQTHISTWTYHTRSKAHRCTPHACMHSRIPSDMLISKHTFPHTCSPSLTTHIHSVPLWAQLLNQHQGLLMRLSLAPWELL